MKDDFWAILVQLPSHESLVQGTRFVEYLVFVSHRTRFISQSKGQKFRKRNVIIESSTSKLVPSADGGDELWSQNMSFAMDVEKQNVQKPFYSFEIKLTPHPTSRQTCLCNQCVDSICSFGSEYFILQNEPPIFKCSLYFIRIRKKSYNRLNHSSMT